MDEKIRMELLNEVGFWSNWARLRWETESRYMILWPDFKEALFNHVGLLEEWKPTKKYLASSEKKFSKYSINPAFFIPKMTALGKSISLLKAEGFKEEDSLDVYESAGDIDASDGVEIRQVGLRGIGEWARIYMRAFYGPWFYNDALGKALTRAVSAKGTKFILAKVRGLPVGCTATYTSEGYTGAYCVGVLSEYRRKGVARTMLAFSKQVAEETGTKLVVQTFRSDNLGRFYEGLGFKKQFSRVVLMKKIFENSEETEIGTRFQSALGEKDSFANLKLEVRINRSLGLREYTFSEAFPGFEKLEAVREIFGEAAPEVLKKVKVVLDPREGYLHVDNEDGTIYISQPYLQNGEEVYLYLDLIHELVHVKQFMQGKELYDRRYEYLERPTELEAYNVGVREARRLGLSDRQIANYLRVDWVEEDEFMEFLKKMKVKY